MQPTDTLTVLFRHHLWANLRLLERCAALTDAQLATRIPGVYGSILATLQHIVTSDQSYLARISTGQPLRRTPGEEPTTIAELTEAARASGQGLIAWAARVRPEDTVRIDWDGIPREVPKSIILAQALSHATEHRAQVAVMLTHLGIEPPDLQGWAYFDELEP